MKHRIVLIASLLMLSLCVSAKKVKVTIDGTLSPTQTKYYLIIDEDTAHAVRLPINDGKFSITVKVDANSFIRLHDTKDWPERSVFVLIPDSRHISINTWTGNIEGSPMSQKLYDMLNLVRRAGPEGFHIDVFSDDKEAWAQARETEKRIRAGMEQEQREIAYQVVNDNSNNIIPAWVVYCYPELFEDRLPMFLKDKPKWAKHPILLKRKKISAYLNDYIYR